MSIKQPTKPQPAPANKAPAADPKKQPTPASPQQKPQPKK